MENREINTEEIKAVMIAVPDEKTDETELDKSFDELSGLLQTAGARGIFTLAQRREKPDVRSYLGDGKCAELKRLCQDNGIELIVADDELSPVQLKNLEDFTGVSVIDRSMLILDIFASRASSAEGKLQVEIAQLKYTIPRLAGKGEEMSRLGGGIGTRGPGESKLESDRRHLRRRINALERKLDELEANRNIRRSARKRSGIFTFAVAGYTNAGKSTLLNLLTDAGVTAEDKLFATLDPTVRKLTLPSGREVLIGDTVGFIKNLPHHLIHAFKSTLDEVRYADAIILLADASDPDIDGKMRVTLDLLDELGCGDKEIIKVYNKCDLLADNTTSDRDGIFISAREAAGIDVLLEKMDDTAGKGFYSTEYFFPMTAQDRVAYLYGCAEVRSVEYTDNGVEVKAQVDAKTRGVLRQWEK